MAVAKFPLTYALATVAAAGTSVAPNNPVPDNCTGIALLNTGANDALFGIGTPGGALVEGTSGSRLKSGASVSLPIGMIDVRGPMTAATLVGSGLIFDAIGGATTVGITYLNEIGR